LAAAITAVSPERPTSVQVMADPEVESDVVPRGRDVLALGGPG
jgi:hypothetical protein